MTRAWRSRPVCIALGANVGNRLENMRSGLARLAVAAPIISVSGLYSTAPVGVTEQPEFLNAACVLDTSLALRDLLIRVKQIEWELGRRPARVWGPRPLDIDIMLAGDEIVCSPDLVVPHARMAERAFVLVPLAEIAGHRRHPTLNRDVAALAAELPLTEREPVLRLCGPEWAI